MWTLVQNRDKCAPHRARLVINLALLFFIAPSVYYRFSLLTSRFGIIAHKEIRACRSMVSKLAISLPPKRSGRVVQW